MGRFSFLTSVIMSLKKFRAGYNPARIYLYIAAILSIGFASCSGNKDSQQASQVKVDTTASSPDTTQAALNAAHAQIDNLTTNTSTLDSELANKTKEVAMLEKQVSSLKKHNRTLERKLRKDKNFIASLKNELSDKAREFATRLGLLESDKTALTNERDSLSRRYSDLKELGSVLHASNIRLLAIHLKHNGKKEKKTERARKVNVMRVTFDIDENRIADDGNKNLYLSITGPDGMLLNSSKYSSGTFTSAKGRSISYSVLKQVYLHQDEPVKDVSVDWQQDGKFKKGVYNIVIYNGGYKIGNGSVRLI
jgi:hypothetical protein